MGRKKLLSNSGEIQNIGPSKSLYKETICINCAKLVESDHQKFMIGLEKPYINLYVHRECWVTIENDLVKFMEKNLENFLKNPQKI